MGKPAITKFRKAVLTYSFSPAFKVLKRNRKKMKLTEIEEQAIELILKDEPLNAMKTLPRTSLIRKKLDHLDKDKKEIQFRFKKVKGGE